MVRSPTGTKKLLDFMKKSTARAVWLRLGSGNRAVVAGRRKARDPAKFRSGTGGVGAGNGCAASRAGLPGIGLRPEGGADTMPADSAYSLRGAGWGFNTKAASATNKRRMWRCWQVENEVSGVVQQGFIDRG
jgi:hypothetical protein